MKQTIEIEVPEGYKAVYNKDTQKVEIVKVNLPKSWEEFCDMFPKNTREYFINEGSCMTGCSKERRHINIDKKVLPNIETAEAFLALMQLIQLRDCYWQGWKPNWKKACEKYCIYYENDNISPFNNIYNSRVLSFQSEEIRDEFLKNFSELIEKAKELI